MFSSEEYQEVSCGRYCLAIRHDNDALRAIAAIARCASASVTAAATARAIKTGCAANSSGSSAA